MSRRPPLRRVPAPDPLTRLQRVVKTISDGRVIVGVVVSLFVGGGIAYAFVGGLATKADVAVDRAHLQEHDVEFAGFKQAIEDIRETVHQIHDDQRLQSSPHR